MSVCQGALGIGLDLNGARPRAVRGCDEAMCSGRHKAQRSTAIALSGSDKSIIRELNLVQSEFREGTCEKLCLSIRSIQSKDRQNSLTGELHRQRRSVPNASQMMSSPTP
jgi:hypothetical protein